MLLFTFPGIAQTDTIRLQDSQLNIYLCSIDSLNNWYLFTEDHHGFTLSRLTIPSVEAASWYRRFEDSQNLYRASLLDLNGRQMLNFKRSESDEAIVYFELIEQTQSHLKMWVAEINQTFLFQRISTD